MHMPETGWSDLNWKQIESRVFQLQQQIYISAKDREIRKVRKLQHNLLKHPEAKLLSVRRVTQDNRGKRTAGIDGRKELTPQERLKLAKDLRITGTSYPVKRIYIPKTGTDQVRPLGIPTIEDRARQMLVKLALEPEWEAYFEPNSYGFRPGRNCHDAIKQIKVSIERSPKYVLDADISKCFDSINHDALLKKLNVQGQLRRQIKAWLEAGYIEFPSKKIEATEMGTPQGGVISPLLANIALHGLENRLKEISRQTVQYYPSGNRKPTANRRSTLTVVRYADDFVIMHPDKEILLLCKRETEIFLQSMGLKLNEAKTRLSHTLDPTLSEDKEAGFNFLGFHIIQKAEKDRSAVSSTTKEKLGFRTLLLPSKKSLKKYQMKISAILRSTTDQDTLIRKLAPVISGWSRYFGISSVQITGTFHKLDELLYLKLRQWGYKRTLSRSKSYISYWIRYGTRMVFGNENFKLPFHRDFASSITHYIKVRGECSPFDGNESYWSKRFMKSPHLPTTKQKLLTRQKGLCNYCKNPFRDTDILEIHHIKPRKEGGKDVLSNLEVIHGHCHDKIHSTAPIAIDEIESEI